MKTTLHALILLAAVAGTSAAETSAARAADGGAALFDNHCAVCHQAGGVGVAGVFPRLSGRAPAIAASPAGRQFLSSVVLNGMSGKVSVDDKPIVGVMPGFDTLSDADLATILTYVSHLGAPAKVAAFKGSEIASARGGGKASPSAMAAQRNKLAADKVIP